MDSWRAANSALSRRTRFGVSMAGSLALRTVHESYHRFFRSALERLLSARLGHILENSKPPRIPGNSMCVMRTTLRCVLVRRCGDARCSGFHLRWFQIIQAVRLQS